MTRPMLANVDPEGFRAVLGLEKHLRARLDQKLFELVWLRSSMVNGCAFCVDLHSRSAQRTGESIERMLALTAWEESSFFTADERAALALADAVTSIEGGVDDDVWSRAVDAFGEAGTVDIVMATAAINVWNRVAISTQMRAPGGASEGADKGQAVGR